MRNLRPNSLRQSIGHRPMIERAQQPPAPVHGQIARRPNHGSPNVRGEDSIRGGQIVNHLGHVLGMNRKLSRLACRQRIQILARLAIVLERRIQMTAIFLLLDGRQQRTQRFRNAAHNAQIDAAAAAQLLLANVDLHNARVFWIELLIRKIRSQHQ